MAVQTFALEKGGPRRLLLSWKISWRDMQIRLDGSLIGEIATQQELRQGHEFTLPDGSTLSVKLVNRMLWSELQVLRDGVPLPASQTDPETRLRASYGVLYFIAAINIVVGLVAEIFQVELLQSMGLGFLSAGIGAIYLVLGYFVMRRSMAALLIALVLFTLDTLLSLLSGFNIGIVMRIILLFYMAQGVRAILDLKGAEAIRQ